MSSVPTVSRALQTAGCLLGLVVTLMPAPATAQQSADSIRAAARRDYHGPDLTGKDGPLSKAGLPLLVLYHEYQAFQAQGPDTTFVPTVSGVRVREGRIGVEAVATDSAAALLADLKALGLTDGITAGRLVSGWLPIDQIPAMARLESLRGLIQSKATTREDESSPSRTPPPPPGTPGGDP